MKRIITLITLLTFTGLLLPSCGISVVKRQHTGGYYISTNHRHSGMTTAGDGKTENDQQLAKASSQQEETEKEAVVLRTETEKVASAEETYTSETTENTSSTVPAPKAAAVRTEKEHKQFAGLGFAEKIAEHIPAAKKMDTKTKKAQSASSARSDGGLSLFWIVILVLLILWALGLLGGYTGGLIYLLLVIALILLILWLLRVI